MDQEKIGKFIAKLRKEKNMTQMMLAEKLDITDRAVSKWERGLSLPDASIMIELCNILDITVNELLSGQSIRKENYMEKAEKNLIELQKQNEEYAKKLLALEWVIGYGSSIILLVFIFVASFLEMNIIIRIILIVGGLILFLIGASYCLMIEQKAGYYECGKCHHKYVPTYKNVFFAMHIGRTRYLKCPKCNKRSWNKKVISK